MHTTLKLEHRHSEVVKNSEFLGFAAPIQTVQQAQDCVAALRARYPDASHVCWAYRLAGQYRFSDDGEPAGTAGAPMHRALEQSGLDAVVVAVVRFYGGVNLGAGGLARAYGGVVATMLRLAERLVVHDRVAVRVCVSFAHTAVLHRLLVAYDLTSRHDEFSEAGLVVTGELLEAQLEGLRVALRDATKGQGGLKEL